MGAEQSSQRSSQPPPATDPAPSSPRPSISSDSDVPYVSYTVNRPIGDSPKLKPKRGVHLRSSTPSPSRSTPSPAHRPHSYTGQDNIIVVKEATVHEDTLENDPEMLRLQSIPSFMPIMRAALNVPTMRDPEVLDKLDHHSVYLMLNRYELHLKRCAETVATEQIGLATRIKELDFAIAALLNQVMDQQKKLAKHTEKLNKVQEISSALTRCDMVLRGTLEIADTLNQLLPEEERLEPFVWTTG